MSAHALWTGKQPVSFQKVLVISHFLTNSSRPFPHPLNRTGVYFKSNLIKAHHTCHTHIQNTYLSFLKTIIYLSFFKTITYLSFFKTNAHLSFFKTITYPSLLLQNRCLPLSLQEVSEEVIANQFDGFLRCDE